MSNNLVVVSKEQCVKCNMTKKFLDNKGIEYENKMIDVYSDENKDLIQQFRDAGFSSFPVVFPSGMDDWSDAWCDYRLDKLRAL